MTFSIIALTDDSIGVAVASGSKGVGKRVPWLKSGVGSVATQGYTKTYYGKRGLELMGKGHRPRETLKLLLDENRGREKRQVAMMDMQGRNGIHTGGKCPAYTSLYQADGIICIGNLLETEDVAPKMASGYGKGNSFPWKLVHALIEGSKEGGDKRGERSAALLAGGSWDLKIRIDDSENPISELGEELESLDSG